MIFLSRKDELEILKLQKLILMGDEVYYQIRAKRLMDQKLCAIAEELIAIDKELYAFSGNVTPEKSDGICHSCHTKLEGDVKFCGSCGANIDEYYSKATVYCARCNGIIGVSDNFCPICGSKKED